MHWLPDDSDDPPLVQVISRCQVASSGSCVLFTCKRTSIFEPSPICSINRKELRNTKDYVHSETKSNLDKMMHQIRSFHYMSFFLKSQDPFNLSLSAHFWWDRPDLLDLTFRCHGVAPGICAATSERNWQCQHVCVYIYIYVNIRITNGMSMYTIVFQSAPLLAAKHLD